MLELAHHSFIAYPLPTTGEIVPMLQIAPSKTDAERLLLVSSELAEVLTAVIFRVRAGKAALPMVSAYDVFEQTWSAPMPLLFRRRYGSEDRPINRSYIRECMVTTPRTAQITIAGQPLEWRPHDFRRIFVTDALRSGMPPHIAAKICGHALLDTTMGYAAIYPEDVVSHHRAFIARRQPDRPSGPAQNTATSPPASGMSSWPISSCGKSRSGPAAATTAPRVRMKTLASGARSSRSTQLRCRGWKRSTPPSATGSPKQRTRAGSVRSPRSRPPWPPPDRNWRPCADAPIAAPSSTSACLTSVPRPGGPARTKPDRSPPEAHGQHTLESSPKAESRSRVRGCPCAILLTWPNTSS